MEDRQRGVTLVESMIAVAIVGILASIAYPSYRSQVLRSTRTEARIALEQRALQLEKCFTMFMSYNAAACTAGQAAANSVSPGNHYLITISPTGSNMTTFTLTATARDSQRADGACPALTIDQAGARGPAHCW